MSKDQLLGVLILIGSIAVIWVYRWSIYAGYGELALYTIATIAVVGFMGIIAWIGWTMATTPAPEPIELMDEPESEK